MVPHIVRTDDTAAGNHLSLRKPSSWNQSTRIMGKGLPGWKWPEECNEARKVCLEQEFRFLEGWQS